MDQRALGSLILLRDFSVCLDQGFTLKIKMEKKEENKGNYTKKTESVFFTSGFIAMNLFLYLI
jgi:hypothetical protein